MAHLTAGPTPLTSNQVRGFWAAWGGWALDGMDSFIYALVLTPAITELLPRSGIEATPGNIGYYGSLLFALFLFGWGCSMVWGPLADRFGRVKTLMLMQCLMGLSYLMWAIAHDRMAFAIFALWFGLSYGSIVSLLPAICMDLFGGKAVSAIIGTLYTGAAFGNLLGPVLAGQVFDLTGQYNWVIWITLCIAAVATFSCWRILKYPQQPH